MNYINQIDKYLKRLFPICRSLTGQGNRETLRILSEIVPINIGEYPSGTKAYDWTIPKEWNIRDAWVKNSEGEKIIDFKRCNLHVVNYSVAVHQKIRGVELKRKLHFREDLPDAIPYRTSYYKEDWGFCLSFEEYQKCICDDEEYEVVIDAELKNGSLSYGEILIPGRRDKEYLISTYICHPSMANDNLSGPVLTAFLAKELMNRNLNYSYRIIFVPETIGAIAYCAHNENVIKNVELGMVVTCVGGPGLMGYKQSWDKDHYINRISEQVLSEYQRDFKVYPFDFRGSDERQYSSPGFRMNCISLTKDKYYDYPQYHTSLDNLDFVDAANINLMLEVYLKLIEEIDSRVVYERVQPKAEIMLSKHELYPSEGGWQIPGLNSQELVDQTLSVLFWCDGEHSVNEIAYKSGFDEVVINEILGILIEKELVKLSDG